MSNLNDEALHHAVQRWAREIRYRSGWTVETILVTGEKLLAARKELAPHGPKARAMLATETRLSRPMMSRLEAIGRHATLFRPRAANLPPHISSLYALTRKPLAQLGKAIGRDLRGMTRTEIGRLFTTAPPPKGSRVRLMTIAAPASIAAETRLALTADIRLALERIGLEHGVGLAVSPRRAAGPLSTVRRRSAPLSSDRHPPRL
jgi:hypothetical protein